MLVRQLSPSLVGLALVLTAGCAPSPQVGTTPEDPTRQVEPTAPGATSTPGSRSGGAVITFERSGGIVGISELWSIYLDGRVIEAEGAAGQVPADEVSQLLAEIDAAGFFEWPPPARSLESCADCFTYSITVEYQGKTNRITIVDGGSGAPEGAGIVLERILGILNSVSE